MEELYKELKELARKITSTNCDFDCDKCPFGKEVYEEDTRVVALCSILNKIAF